MRLIKWIEDNPDWFSNSRSRLRVKLENGDTRLLCSEYFLDVNLDEALKGLKAAEVIGEEPWPVSQSAT
jgi:hypothetical protein